MFHFKSSLLAQRHEALQNNSCDFPKKNFRKLECDSSRPPTLTVWISKGKCLANRKWGNWNVILPVLPHWLHDFAIIQNSWTSPTRKWNAKANLTIVKSENCYYTYTLHSCQCEAGLHFDHIVCCLYQTNPNTIYQENQVIKASIICLAN